MMEKRNLIEEIKSIKGRTEYNPRLVYEQRFEEISQALEKLRNPEETFNKELFKYIPIATVACFEAFFQHMNKMLIDSGSPYSQNITGFSQCQTIRLDFDIIAAIQAKMLTVGDFVAYLLPYSNLKVIASNFKIITHKELLPELKEFCQAPGPPYLESSWQKFRSDPDHIIKGVKNTFTLRHIFCHEFASTLKFDVDELTEDFECCFAFLSVSFRYIIHLLYPDSTTDAEENEQRAMNEFQNAEDELSGIVQRIDERIHKFASFEEGDMESLRRSLSKWAEYRAERVNFKTKIVGSTIVFPTSYYWEMTAITKEKILSMETELAEILRRDVFKYRTF